LKKLTQIYPYSDPTDFSVTVEDEEKRVKAVRYLKKVRKAEESGLQSLEKILQNIR
jgi:hypothetical protein